MSNREKIKRIINEGPVEKLTEQLFIAAACLDTDIMIGIEPCEAYQDIFEAYRVCAENGMTEAWFELGKCYKNGIGTKANRRKALECYAKAGLSDPETGDITVAKHLYWVANEYQEAFEYCKKALKGPDKDGEAHYLMGLMSYNGYGTRKNIKESFTYHQKAAELGNPDAMFEMYVLISTGQGCEQDNEAALEWCIKAAEKGQTRACYNMGAFYATGRGVELDVKQSECWYDRAARNGHGKAAATLGVMYLQGEIEAKNAKKKAEEYFQLAEENDFEVNEFLEKLGLERK